MKVILRTWPGLIMGGLALLVVTEKAHSQCKSGRSMQSATGMPTNSMQQLQQQQLQLMLLLNQLNGQAIYQQQLQGGQTTWQEQQRAMMSAQQQQLSLLTSLRQQHHFNAYLIAQQKKLAKTLQRLQSGTTKGKSSTVIQQFVSALQTAYQQTQSLLSSLPTTGPGNQTALVTSVQNQLSTLATLIQQYSSSSGSTQQSSSSN